MKRDLRRTIEADGHYGRSGADRRVAGHVSVFPCARAEGSRQRGVKREGDAAGEANLPPMRMPAQQQIESSTRGLPVYFRRVGQKDRKVFVRNRIRRFLDIVHSVKVAVVDPRR